MHLNFCTVKVLQHRSPAPLVLACVRVRVTDEERVVVVVGRAKQM